MPAEIGDYDSRIIVTTDTETTTASEGENVGSVTINGITYGLYIKAEGSTIDFEIKENEGSTPLPITVHGLNVFGPQIEFYKTDENTYVMSAINLVWAPEPSITVITSPQLPLINRESSQNVELTKSNGTAWTEQDFIDLVVMVDGDKCLVTAGSSEISYATRNIYATIARSYIGQTTAIMQTGNISFTLESIDLG